MTRIRPIQVISYVQHIKNWLKNSCRNTLSKMHKVHYKQNYYVIGWKLYDSDIVKTMET